MPAWTSLLDIAIAAAMLYYLYVWLVRTRSTAIVVGLLALGFVYLGASALGLHLTTGILQGFYAVALIAVIIIFQPELRRILENVGFIGGRPDRGGVPPTVVRSVAETLFDLAGRRVGALVVVSGRGPIERHLTGGVPLNGVVSSQLMASLFDPHSPGHDGAVVWEGDRLTQFGCYLPLSTQPDLGVRYGTRHRAALGLSEVADCLVLVVSEESGKVSVAHEGTLTTLSTSDALETTVEQFLAVTGVRTRTGAAGWRRLTQRPVTKLGAIAVATGLWFLTGEAPAPMVRARLESPIVYENLADTLYIASGGLHSVSADLEGPPDAITMLQQEPPSLVVNLADVGAGPYVVSVGDTQYRLPDAVRLLDATPSSITLQIERFRETAVPVVVTLTGEPAEDFRVAQVRAQPAAVPVLHKAGAPVNESQISTDPVDVTDLRKDLDIEVALNWPTGVRPAHPDMQTVQVLVRLNEIEAPPRTDLAPDVP